jgi:O-antigen/teichoic acid export membrane protein
LISLFFSKTLGSLIDFPGAFLWVIPFYCLCQNVSEIVLSSLRLKNQVYQYGIFRIGRTILEVGLSIGLVALIPLGWLGRMDAMVISMFLFGVLAVVALYKKNLLKGWIRKDDLKSITRFGVPLIPHVVGGMVMIYSDRIFIAKMVGLAETGSYTVGYQVAMAISLLQSSFNLAWVPWFYGKLNQNDDAVKLKIVKFTYLYNVLILLSAIGLTLIAPLIFSVFINKNYGDSLQFVWWVALGFAFDGMYKMVVNYLFYVKKTYIISIITFGVAILNIILNYFLIKNFGAVGAAQATAISLCCEFIIVWIISAKVYEMPWLYLLK